MLSIQLPAELVLDRVRSEFVWSQTDQRSSRLYLLKSMLEMADSGSTVDVDEELFQFLDL